jgi:hypothetical protein
MLACPRRSGQRDGRSEGEVVLNLFFCMHVYNAIMTCVFSGLTTTCDERLMLTACILLVAYVHTRHSMTYGTAYSYG